MLLLPLLRRGAGVLALAAAFFACEGDPTTLSNPDSPVTVTQYTNPVHAGDFADPFVLVADSGYYAYATNHRQANVPVLQSRDLGTWSSVGDAMPALPSWAASDTTLTWAPAVLALNQRYILFFTARDLGSGLQCIGRAESTSPTGPFLDQTSSPFLCQIDLGGSIDASVVRDSANGIYLLWKNDGNCCGKAVTLWSQQLSEDGSILVGPRAALLQPDRPWEGPLIEAPSMWQENGAWHLLYSANMWNTDRYATGYGMCDSPLGPCRKVGEGPLLASDAETAGPGGAEVFEDLEGRRWLAYHGWTATRVGYRNGGARSLRLDRIQLAGTQMVVNGPTTTMQIVP